MKNISPAHLKMTETQLFDTDEYLISLYICKHYTFKLLCLNTDCICLEYVLKLCKMSPF